MMIDFHHSPAYLRQPSDYSDGDGAQPVYLQMDFFDPHQPFSIPDGFAEREKQLRAAFRQLPASYERVRARDWKQAANEPKVYNFYARNWGLYRPETAVDYRVANALQIDRCSSGIERVGVGQSQISNLK